MIKFFFFLLTATTLFALSINEKFLQSQDSLIDITPRFSLGWTFNRNSTINFLVIWKQKSWIGLGFGPDV